MSKPEDLDVHRYPSWSWDESFQRVDHIYRQFASLGIATVAASRMNAYRRALRDLRGAAVAKRRLTLREGELLIATIVETHQLHVIVRAAVSSRRPEEWRTQLLKLVSGPAHIRRESKHSPAHDFQFEAFVAAIAELSGYSVRFEEPDLVVSEGSECVLGIAAKRVRSPRRAEARCREAVKQIQSATVPGLVALDLSLALYPGKCVNTNDPEGAVLFAKAVADQFVQRNARWLNRVCSAKDVLGLLVHVQLPALNLAHPVSPQLLTTMRWTLVPSPADERSSKAVTFARRCELGLFGPRRDDEYQRMLE